MGLIRAAAGAVTGVLADQWKEYFYCESLDNETLAVKGQKRTSGRSSNVKGEDNIITSGSTIAVADGQCMLIVEQGKVVEVSCEPGEYIFDASTEPTIFSGDLSDSIKDVFSNIGKRFTYGGQAPKDQRVYYFNTKEILGNKYGTPNPVPFRVVDENIGLDMDVSIRCFGEYSFKITNPLLFYTNIMGNDATGYTRDRLDSQLKSELLTALQPAFAKISAAGIRYSQLPGHTHEIVQALNESLSTKWRDLRGLEIVSFNISGVKANDEDEQMIKELQRNATFRNPNMAAAHLVGAQASAMQKAASNEGAGAAMAFMGMNMASTMGGMTGQSFVENVSSTASPAPNTSKSEPTWDCSCGHTSNKGAFCEECGKPKEIGWTCECGAINKGKFCSTCGKPKPKGAPQYQCDKCGWEPKDPTNPPKFCPECGDIFDEEDIK